MRKKMLLSPIAIIFLIFIFPGLLRAGQISVINPSAASTEATGVVTISPSSPSTTLSSPTAVNTGGSPYESQSLQYAPGTRMNIVTETLKSINIHKFSNEQRQSLIKMIQLKLSDTKISNDIKDILIEQITRLKL